MRDDTAAAREPWVGWLAAAVAAVAAFRVATTAALTHPGYTDAYYYYAAAQHLAAGDGLVVDLVWNFLEAPGMAPLPVPSHRFWMPLASILQASGIAVLGAPLGPFRAAQTGPLLFALAIPVVTFVAARRLGLDAPAAALAAFVAGLGGVYAPGWSSLDNFAPVAVLATVAFASLPGVAAGVRRDAIVAGTALGAVILARADGALYALMLAAAARSRRTAALALGVMALVAAPAYARNLALGLPEGQLARTALLVRYEDFFRITPPTFADYLGALDAALTAKADALVGNAGTFLLVTSVILGPLALVRCAHARGEPIARAWVLVAGALYLVHSLVFTLHGTRGAFSHSFAGLFPVGSALAVASGRDLIRSIGARREKDAAGPRRDRVAARLLGGALPQGQGHLSAKRSRRSFVAASSLAAAMLALSAYSVATWRSEFDAPFEARRAAAATGAIETPALVVDAAAWRALLDGPTLVTPADGLVAAREVARRYGARTLVLEPVRFSAYDALYTDRERVEWLEPVTTSGAIRVWRIRQTR